MHSQFTSTKWAKSQHESFQMAWKASQHITLKLPKNIGPPPHRKGNSEERDTDFGFDSTDRTKCVEPENHQCRTYMTMPHFRICSGRSTAVQTISSPQSTFLKLLLTHTSLCRGRSRGKKAQCGPWPKVAGNGIISIWANPTVFDVSKMISLPLIHRENGSTMFNSNGVCSGSWFVSKHVNRPCLLWLTILLLLRLCGSIFTETRCSNFRQELK